MNYTDFLRAKVRLAEQLGFDVADADVNPILTPHQRDMVRWMVRMGRAAFLDPHDIATLTGIKSGRDGIHRDVLQAAQLRRMGIAHWINARGAPVVPRAAVEGGKVAAVEKQQAWTPVPLRAG